METKAGKVKAENVTVVDTGVYFTTTNVEDVLQEIRLTSTDDGSYITVSVGAVKLFKIRKSDGQLLIAGGLDADQTL